MQLGKRIRSMRFRRGLTVQQLAEASGLSKGFISQVENDRTSPSLATLRDLARALDTTVAYLVVEDEQAPYVVRQISRPRIQHDGNGARMEVLSMQPRRNLELTLAELPAGAQTPNGSGTVLGELCMVCLDGRVTVTCGEHTLVLEKGDSCHHDGQLPHTIENTGTETARVLIAATAVPAELPTRARQTNSGVEATSLA